jgi:membrane protease YdiL (CAAX protease family)
MQSRSIAVPVLIFAILVQAFLLINGQLIFGSAWNGYQNILMIYVALDAVFLGLAVTSGIPYMEIDIWNAIIIFIIVFLISAFSLSALFRIAPITISINNIVLDFVFQIFVIAYTEELLFRGLLLQYIGPIWQGIAFGVFHLTSYYTPLGINWISIVVAIVMGIIFGYVVKYFDTLKKPGIGITITWAIHSAWNLALLTTLFVL